MDNFTSADNSTRNKSSSIIFRTTPRLLEDTRLSLGSPAYHNKIPAVDRSADIKREPLTLPPVSTRFLFKKPGPSTKLRSETRLVELNKNVTALLKKEIEEAWEHCQLPEYFKEMYRALLFSLPLSLSSAEIGRQIQEFNSGSSPVLVALDAVKSREDSLAGLKELDASLGGLQVKSQYLLNECIDLLHEFRLLSLKVLEAVLSWRKQVYVIQQSVLKSYLIGKMSALPFVWEGVNYLLKMKSDGDWLLKANLSKYFGFSQDSSDPFLLKCSQTLKSGVSEEGRLPMSRLLMKRIMDAELILAEETVCESIKPPNFTLAVSTPISTSSSLVTTPHPGYPDLPEDRRGEERKLGKLRLDRPYREVKESSRYSEHREGRQSIEDDCKLEPGESQPKRRTASTKLHRRRPAKEKDHKQAKPKNIRERMAALMVLEIFDELFDVYLEIFAADEIRAEIDSQIAEAVKTALEQASTAMLLRVAVKEASDEVISEELLEFILQDPGYLQEVAGSQQFEATSSRSDRRTRR
jgi:hypothetical protein